MDSTAAVLREAFENRAEVPPISLRAGNAIDSGEAPPLSDPVADVPSAEYFEQNFWGLPYLDPSSWRYYLPLLLQYSMENLANPASNAVQAFLFSLRPPDRDPPRFASLSPEQQRAVSAVLEQLAFHADSAWQEPAMIALEEFWAAGVIYR